MALQGDLTSFTLPDVLRLLAGTGKSGCLVIDGHPSGGRVLLHQGAILGGNAAAAPRAVVPADVVFELLRIDGGSFLFDEGDQPGGPTVPVDEVLAAAEDLVRQWDEVEAVVPSMKAWISLAPELDVDVVQVTAEQWRSLAAIGGGGNVRDLAGALDLTDLAACRRVVDLADAGLVLVRPSHGYTPPEVELDDFEDYEVPMDDPMTDLEDLVVEDRPVVMEDREDALLPEPLPGEGVAYEGDIVAATVDGHAFDAHEQDEALADDPFEAFEAMAAVPAPADHEVDDDEAHEPYDDQAYAAPVMEVVEDVAPAGYGYEEPVEAPRTEDVSPLLGAAATEGIDDERNSLLKFLSTVKP